ncbi:MAG: hypothetical protein ACREEP_00675 [Dongiaceae bacterium]
MRRAIMGIVALLAGLGSARADDEWRVSTSGLGPARIGMTLAEASQALHMKLVADGPIDSHACYYVRTEPVIEGLWLMVSKGRVVRFDVDAPGVKTRSGLGVGDTEAHVIEVLGPSVEVTPHKYLGPNGNYVTIWSSTRQSAVRFETYLGKVTSFYAGRVPEVNHIEGCA